jgi:uncharacterized protein (TIGR00297 family)
VNFGQARPIPEEYSVSCVRVTYFPYADSQQLMVGFGLAIAVAVVAWAFRALTIGGAAAASVVGGTVFGLGGPEWASVLIAFFASSSALSRWTTGTKHDATTGFAKGSRRDATQVIANGAVGATLAAVHAATLAPWAFVGFVGAMAAVTADTWATEVGLLSRVPPRLITTGAPVRPGTSGAVSSLGSAAAVAGAVFISTVAFIAAAVAAFQVWGVPDLSGATLLVIGPVAGLAGAVTDSWLGATVQAVYRCPRCEKETERRVHSCGTASRLARGREWLTNDLVNLAASVVGAVVAIIIGRALFL